MGGHDGPLVRKSVEVYNPDTNCWSPVADMNLCRRNAGMCSCSSLCNVKWSFSHFKVDFPFIEIHSIQLRWQIIKQKIDSIVMLLKGNG